MAATGTGAAGCSAGRLALHPDFDQALRDLLGAATPWVLERAARHTRAPALLLVLGSAACGEAGAVSLGGKLLPLSDLDLGLFLETGLTGEQAAGVRRELARHLQPVVDRHRLTRDPVDLGIYDLGFVRRMPPTLELCEAARAPRVLGGDGDPAALGATSPPEPPPFEALRLALNRLVEAFAEPAPPITPVRPASPDWPPASITPDWPAVPDEASWRRAHRCAKLPADLLKALMAARGALEPSLARRLALVRPTLAAAGLEPGRPDRWGGQAAAGVIEAWIAWRLRPQWPPPALAASGIADLTRAVLAAVCGRLGRPLPQADRPGSWRALLAAEGGPERERIRRWRRMRARRPAGGVGPLAALRVALRWAPSGAWPASLALLAFGLAWLEQADEPSAGVPPAAGALEPRVDARRAAAAPAESALARGLGMVHWARFAGA